MARLPEPCLTCGIVQTNGSRCLTHALEYETRRNNTRRTRKDETGQYKGAYTRLAKIVRATGLVCHLCKQPFQPGDKINADHLEPGARVYDISQLAPAHASCNQSRGNKPLTPNT